MLFVPSDPNISHRYAQAFLRGRERRSEQTSKDKQLKEAFAMRLVQQGFEPAPGNIAPEQAQAGGYVQTPIGFWRKKAPESSVKWLGKGGLGTGAPPGVATKTRGVTTGFAPRDEKDAWVYDKTSGTKFQAPRSEAAEMMGLSPDRYARGQPVPVDKPERLYETDEGFLPRDTAIGKGKAKKETITNLKTGFEREVSREVAKRLVGTGKWDYGKPGKTAKATDSKDTPQQLRSQLAKLYGWSPWAKLDEASADSLVAATERARKYLDEGKNIEEAAQMAWNEDPTNIERTIKRQWPDAYEEDGQWYVNTEKGKQPIIQRQ